MIYPDRTHDLTTLCMHYALLLRSIAFWGHVSILWLLTFLLEQPFSFLPVFYVLIALGIFTVGSWIWAQKQSVVTDTFVLGQLLVDILTLSLLLYLTGGSSNPFVSLFMLPVTFAAALLRPAHIGIVVVLAVTCYTGLMYYYEPMALWQHHGHGFTLHIWGMWAAFLLSAGLVAYFVSLIGSTLRKRDQLLAEAREQALQSEKIVALGSLAAGTAHELGTPLATIAILSKDLENATQAENPKISKKLGLLRSQVRRCKEILSRMSDSTGQPRAESGQVISVDQYLEDIIEDWLKTRPNVTTESLFSGPKPAPQILADQTVTQAILNILNNAADASSELIKIDGNWDDKILRIQVHDTGAGLPKGLEDRLGEEPFLTTKSTEKGLGLGLYLAKTTLARLGGSITLNNRKDTQGVTVEITLPLDQLLTHD